MNTTLCENIDWVGAVDWTIRDFHSYETERGATYNAYLVRDEKTALVDTVKAPFADELLRNVAALCDPSRVDYIVCNHAENAAIENSTAQNSDATGTTEVVVRQDPSVKAVGSSVKLGLIVYIW